MDCLATHVALEQRLKTTHFSNNAAAEQCPMWALVGRNATNRSERWRLETAYPSTECVGWCETVNCRSRHLFTLHPTQRDPRGKKKISVTVVVVNKAKPLGFIFGNYKA